MDSVISPATAIALGQAGGLGVLDLEGLWTRYDDPEPLLAEIAGLDGHATRRMQEIYAAPIKPDLVRAAARDPRRRRDRGRRATPQRTQQFWQTVVDAGVDLFVIRGTTVSAEHVSGRAEPLNLKRFIYELDVPVIVGGCATYTAALHLMRTGAAGVLVGFGGGAAHTTRTTLGIHAPMATAVADVAAARRDYMDESGGRYVHVIADGGMGRSGDLVKAVACGADAVMLGAALARADEAPGRRLALGPGGAPPAAAARRAGRGRHAGPLAEILRARAAPRTARPTSSVRCGGRWRPPATPTSRSSSASRSWSRPTSRPEPRGYPSVARRPGARLVWPHVHRRGSGDRPSRDLRGRPGPGASARPRVVAGPRAATRPPSRRPPARRSPPCRCPRRTTSRWPSTRPGPRSAPGRSRPLAERARRLPAAARPRAGRAERPARPDPDRERQGPRARVRGGRGRRRRRPPLRPPRAGLPAAPPAPGRVPAAVAGHRAAPPARRRRHHRALELPAHARGERRAPGAGRRQRASSSSPTPRPPSPPCGRSSCSPGPGLPDGSGAGRPRRRARRRRRRWWTTSTTSASPAPPRTGRDVAQQARRRLVGACLELGGKNPMLRRAGRRPRTGRGRRRPRVLRQRRAAVHLRSSGCTCTPTIADAFLDRSSAASAALRLGAALDYGADMGSLTSAHQLDVVAGTCRTLATTARGCWPAGRPGPTSGPLFYEPTVLEGVDTRHAVLRGRDVRAGRVGLPRAGRRRGGAARERGRVRPERQRLDPRRAPAADAVAARLRPAP